MIFCILFCYTSFCSASFDFTYNDTDYSVPDLDCYDYFFITYTNGEFQILSFESLDNITFCLVNTEIGISSSGKVNYFETLTQNGSWSSTLENGKRYGTLSKSRTLSTIIYSSFDITDTEGNVLFQGPVLTTETPTLGEVLEKANPVETFQTMTHGMITYLLVFLVGLVAFWKAWSLLSKSLRKA